MKLIRISLLSAALLTSGGCFLQKKPAALAPVPAPPTPTASSAPAPPPEQANPMPVPAQQPAPTIPPPAPTESGKPSPFPATTAKPVTPAPIKPVPAPALGAILSADQRTKLEAAYQSDLKQANLVFGRLSGKALTAEQLDSVNRTRAFIRQAAQYHDRDLATAAELARRARVLTQDLAGALK